MSAGQRALWFEQCSDPGSNAYNLGACVRFRQTIDRSRLDIALALLADRHPLLRARFDLVDGEPAWSTATQPLTVTMLGDDGRSEVLASERIGDIVLRPYRLAAEHPFRFALAQLEEGSLFVIACHHIVSDLHSLEIIVRELDLAYSDPHGERLRIMPASATYADFCAWQHHLLQTNKGIASADFWSKRLSNIGDAPQPPLAEALPASAAQTSSRINFSIRPKTAAALTAIAAAAAATPYTAVLTTFQALLARHYRSTGAVIGTPFSGRTQARFRDTVGYFVNLLPMTFETDPAESFSAAVARNGKTVRSALRHGQYPFSAMVERMALPRASAAVPLVRATLSYQNTASGLSGALTRLALGLPGGGFRLGGEIGEIVPLPPARPQFPLGVTIAPMDDGFEGSLEYDLTRFKHADAEAFLADWLALNELCAEHPEAAMGTLLEQAVAGPSEINEDLASALEECIARHADLPALEGDSGSMSYRQLGERSALLVAALQELGLGHGARVAVVGDGAENTIVAMVGILRSGAAFVPIDADVGAARTESLLRAARASALVLCTDTPMTWSAAPQLPQLSMARIGGNPVTKLPRSGLARRAPLDPAWLMFTSGTTGSPKAAVIPHEAALAHAQGIAERFGLQAADRVLQFSSLAFDEHAEEIFPTLLAGACLVCMPRIRFQDPAHLLEQARRTGVSVLHLPTSYWHLWMDEMAQQALAIPDTLRLVNAGGEQASVARLRIWAERMPPRIRWFNSYGLTEAAVTSLIYEFLPDVTELERLARVPVGLPIAGSSFKIAAQAGDAGELILGGKCVGLGYLDDVERSTAFFTEASDNGPVRWFRTGDLARVDAAGNVEVLGRLDRSVKLRGVRVALPELEAAVAGHPAVRECVATAAGGEGRDDTRIDLHVALLDGKAVTEQALLTFAQAAMSAATATAVHFYAAIPRTAGRKPDFARLRKAGAAPHPVASSPGGHGKLDERVMSLFTRYLPRAPIAPQDNFFSIGGHSLLAMRIVAALRRELRIEFSIADFMSAPTVEGVSRICSLRQAEGSRAENVMMRTEAAGRYPLSHAQRRALAMTAAAGQGAAPAAIGIRISGSIDSSTLQRAWNTLLTRHRLLSAAISEIGNVEQDIPDAMLRIGHIDLSSAAMLPRQQLAREARAAFARSADPHAVLAATLLTCGASEHILFIQARHAAVDGASVTLLLRELAQACMADSFEIVSGASSYRDYVAAEANWLNSPSRAAAAAYWARQLDGAGAPTRLPEMADVSFDDFSSRRIGFTLKAETRDSLLVLARTSHCTPFSVLLAAMLVLLHRYTGHDDLLIGVPISLRDVLGMGDMAGPTLNALPFRARLASSNTFSELLARTQEALNMSLEHAVLPFEQIAACRPSLGAMQGSPIPIQLVAQDAVAHRSKDGSLVFEELQERLGQSPVGLLVGIKIGETIRVEFDYRRAVLDYAAAARLVRSLRILLRELLQFPDRPISQARMLSRSHIARAFEERPVTRPASFPALLHEGLAKGARSHPKRIAVVQEGQRWTYLQLEHLANRHARRLLDAGLAPGGQVIIASLKGVAEVVAALAVLKAGGVYIPVAWDTPDVRARELACRTDARIVTGPDGLDTVFSRDHSFDYLAVDLHDCPPTVAPDIPARPGASAYILFTSGSTGEPKGVEMSHDAALSTIAEMLRRFDIGAGDVFYGFSALGFDLSVFDIFGALAAGATLVLPPATARADPFVWRDEMAAHAVTVWNSVPSAFDMLLEACGSAALPCVRRVLLSGDWIGMDLPGRSRRVCPDAMFVALGGATEAAIWSNCHVVEAVDPSWRSIPYGRALDGHAMFVAEPGGWPAPVGVLGEICIGGTGLATAYWGDPGLTAERFTMHAQTGKRIYRTGDRGRYFADGSIEFVGRGDRQVKLHGHRIELGDIEAAMTAHPGVRRALVKVDIASDGRADAIVAYIHPQDGATPDMADLRRHAESRLPAYMRPRHYCMLASIPLTDNGKICWASLPPAGSQAGQPAATGQRYRTAPEQKLAELFATLIPGGLPGREDNFFELGGNSLQAVKLINAIHHAFGRSPSLSQWLAEPTLAHMARLLEGAGAQPAPLLAPGLLPAAELPRRAFLAQDMVFSPDRSEGDGAVLITGATGLIGSELLARYLSHTAAEMICLVRGVADEGPEGRIARKLLAEGIPEEAWRGRVRFVRGDLARESFGLPESEWTLLAKATGTVFHVGADVNLLASYYALEAANVGGTHEAIRLAALAGAPLHFVSSIGVLPYGAGTTVTEHDSIDVPGTLLTAYCQTKWVAEKTVRLAAARGLRCTIYRPGLTLGGAAADGSDMLSMLLALARAAGALPALDIPVDITTAAYVASALVQIAGDSRARGATFHLTHPQPMQFEDLVRRAGLQLQWMPFEEWRTRLERALPCVDDARVAALGAMIAAQKAEAVAPARIDCSGTVSMLSASGIACMPVAEILRLALECQRQS